MDRAKVLMTSLLPGPERLLKVRTSPVTVTSWPKTGGPNWGSSPSGRTTCSRSSTPDRRATAQGEEIERDTMVLVGEDGARPPAARGAGYG